MISLYTLTICIPPARIMGHVFGHYYCRHQQTHSRTTDPDPMYRRQSASKPLQRFVSLYISNMCVCVNFVDLYLRSYEIYRLCGGFVGTWLHSLLHVGS